MAEEGLCAKENLAVDGGVGDVTPRYRTRRIRPMTVFQWKKGRVHLGGFDAIGKRTCMVWVEGDRGREGRERTMGGEKEEKYA